MKALIVIDMQHDFVDGTLGSADAKAIVDKVAAKVKEYVNSNEENIILYTRDTHFTNYLETNEGKHLPVEHCIIGTWGWEIVPEVFNDSNSAVVDKYDFGLHNLPSVLQELACRCYESWEIDSIELVGLCTDICVISNALILKSVFSDVPIYVDAACCAGTCPAAHEAALKVMTSCQIEVIG